MNLLDLFFPKLCVGCKREGSYLCDACLKEEVRQSNLICPICKYVSNGGMTHSYCRQKYGLDGLWFLGNFDGPIKQAIYKLKYKFAYGLSDVLVDLLIDYWISKQPLLYEQIKQSSGKGWLVTPVPLHWMRQNFRGFNQSELIAKQIADKLSLEFKTVLKRDRYTSQQAKLDYKNRQINTYQAFALDTKLDLSGLRIILVDDVWTTGSTMKECCKVLKQNGAKKVWALTIAR